MSDSNLAQSGAESELPSEIDSSRIGLKRSPYESDLDTGAALSGELPTPDTLRQAMAPTARPSFKWSDQLKSNLSALDLPEDAYDVARVKRETDKRVLAKKEQTERELKDFLVTDPEEMDTERLLHQDLSALENAPHDYVIDDPEGLSPRALERWVRHRIREARREVVRADTLSTKWREAFEELALVPPAKLPSALRHFEKDPQARARERDRARRRAYLRAVASMRRKQIEQQLSGSQSGLGTSSNSVPNLDTSRTAAGTFDEDDLEGWTDAPDESIEDFLDALDEEFEGIPVDPEKVRERRREKARRERELDRQRKKEKNRERRHRRMAHNSEVDETDITHEARRPESPAQPMDEAEFLALQLELDEVNDDSEGKITRAAADESRHGQKRPTRDKKEKKDKKDKKERKEKRHRKNSKRRHHQDFDSEAESEYGRHARPAPSGEEIPFIWNAASTKEGGRSAWSSPRADVSEDASSSPERSRRLPEESSTPDEYYDHSQDIDAELAEILKAVEGDDTFELPASHKFVGDVDVTLTEGDVSQAFGDRVHASGQVQGSQNMKSPGLSLGCDVSTTPGQSLAQGAPTGSHQPSPQENQQQISSTSQSQGHLPTKQGYTAEDVVQALGKVLFELIRSSKESPNINDLFGTVAPQDRERVQNLLLGVNSPSVCSSTQTGNSPQPSGGEVANLPTGDELISKYLPMLDSTHLYRLQRLCRLHGDKYRMLDQQAMLQLSPEALSDFVRRRKLLDEFGVPPEAAARITRDPNVANFDHAVRQIFKDNLLAIRLSNESAYHQMKASGMFSPQARKELTSPPVATSTPGPSTIKTPPRKGTQFAVTPEVRPLDLAKSLVEEAAQRLNIDEAVASAETAARDRVKALYAPVDQLIQELREGNVQPTRLEVLEQAADTSASGSLARVYEDMDSLAVDLARLQASAQRLSAEFGRDNQLMASLSAEFNQKLRRLTERELSKSKVSVKDHSDATRDALELLDRIDRVLGGMSPKPERTKTPATPASRKKVTFVPHTAGDQRPTSARKGHAHCLEPYVAPSPGSSPRKQKPLPPRSSPQAAAQSKIEDAGVALGRAKAILRRIERQAELGLRR